MPNFAPVDEQLAYIKKGSAEIIREAELREKTGEIAAVGQAAAREGRIRSHGA